jgi:glycosyltransferase involved in cell wall biosynthesis
MKISVIICTHNPREDYLSRTLEALKQQTLPKDQWEVLIIDNASDEVLASRWDLSWHPYGRHILEAELGLTPARMRGIKEATGELILFVDDDNVLACDYLERSLEIATAMPMLGCFGAGLIEPEFEQKPSPELLPYTYMLALRKEEEIFWSNIRDDIYFPWGAGLVVRADIAERYNEKVSCSEFSKMLDRKGSELNSCGDDEFSWVACEQGYGRGVYPSLRVLHLIDSKRVAKDYLLRIAAGHTYSKAVLHWVNQGVVPRRVRPDSAVNVLGVLFKCKISEFIAIIGRWWKRRRMAPIKREFIEAQASGLDQAAAFIESINKS